VLVLAYRYVPRAAPRIRGPLDGFGLLLLCAGLLLVMDGLVTARLVTAILGVLILAGFVWWERVAEYPIVPLSLFTGGQLAKTYVLEIAIGVLEGSLFFIPTVLVGAQNLSYAQAGLIASLGALMFVVVIPISGRALDRLGSRDVLLAGAILTEIGLAIFAVGFYSLPLTILAMVVAGCGFGALLGAPTRYIVTSETSENRRATAVGLLSQALIVGQILGSSLAGGVIGLAPSELHGYRDAYLCFCGVALVALAIAATLYPRVREQRAQAGKVYPLEA
jgi:MFS family permease